MERNPHLLIEGCAIPCYAIGAKVAYIYIRGSLELSPEFRMPLISKSELLVCPGPSGRRFVCSDRGTASLARPLAGQVPDDYSWS